MSGPSVVSVTVTSPLDTILALGASTRLAATALDSNGAASPGAVFDWTSSDPGVVDVGSDGTVEALAVGTATVSASAEGASGSIRLAVVDADLTAVAALAGDPFASALVASVSSAARSDVEASWSGCQDGAASGDIQTVVDCIDGVRSDESSAADVDSAQLAVLTLFADAIERALAF